MNRLSLLAALSVPLVACSPGAGKMTLAAKDFGAAWPFRAAAVKVVCARNLAIFVTAGGKAYPLNGQAERRPELYRFGPVTNLADLARPDPQGARLIPGEEMSTDAVLKAAITRCQGAGRWPVDK